MNFFDNDRSPVVRFVLLPAVVAALGLLFAACGETVDNDGYGTCPEPQDSTVESGTYFSQNETFGEEVAPPHANDLHKEMTVSRADGEVVITYTHEDGTLVTETWRVKGTRTLQ